MVKDAAQLEVVPDVKDFTIKVIGANDDNQGKRKGDHGREGRKSGEKTMKGCRVLGHDRMTNVLDWADERGYRVRHVHHEGDSVDLRVPCLKRVVYDSS